MGAHDIVGPGLEAQRRTLFDGAALARATVHGVH